MEFVCESCRIRENEAEYIKHRCYRLLEKKNIHEIGAFAELYPYDMMRSAIDCLEYNVYKVTDSIVRKYAEQLAEYVRNQLVNKYALNSFSTFCVRLLAPAMNEEHVKVEIREQYK